MTPYRLRFIDRVYRWAAWRHYPRSDGNVTLIGPDCFADQDATVICWQGGNYYRPPAPGPLADEEASA